MRVLHLARWPSPPCSSPFVSSARHVSREVIQVRLTWSCRPDWSLSGLGLPLPRVEARPPANAIEVRKEAKTVGRAGRMAEVGACAPTEHDVDERRELE